MSQFADFETVIVLYIIDIQDLISILYDTKRLRYVTITRYTFSVSRSARRCIIKIVMVNN